MSSNRSKAQPRRARPLPQGSTLFTPEATGGRKSLEQRSATSLLWLHQLPPWLPPVLAAAFLLLGVVMTGWAGGAALIGLAIALAWLAALSWPRLSAQGRLLRVVVVGCVLAGAVIRALH